LVSDAPAPVINMERCSTRYRCRNTVPIEISNAALKNVKLYLDVISTSLDIEHRCQGALQGKEVGRFLNTAPQRLEEILIANGITPLVATNISNQMQEDMAEQMKLLSGTVEGSVIKPDDELFGMIGTVPHEQEVVLQ